MMRASCLRRTVHRRRPLLFDSAIRLYQALRRRRDGRWHGGHDVEVLLLGTVEVSHEGLRIVAGRRRERGLLGLLTLGMNATVSLDRLAALLWDDRPPASYRDALYVHMARLRSSLDPDGDGRLGLKLLSHRGGYSAEGDPAMVDARRFQSEVATALGVPDPQAKVDHLKHALRLWRGPVLTNALSDQARERVAVELTELRRTAMEQLYQTEIDRGNHRDIVGALAVDAAEEWPDERLTGLLMEAMHRSGRRTDALEVYQRHRNRLAAEFGLDPGAQLQRLQGDILRADERPAAEAAVPPLPSPPPAPPPRQLPAPDKHFVGRQAELARLDALVAARTPAALALICGQPGVGKTALAIRWAHACESFPDGQIYVNLRGFSPGERPLTPAQALPVLLEALGVPAGHVPLDIDTAAARFRSLTADRALLLVLDNAASIPQVRPLLPGGERCMTIVTSRHALPGLVAREGATRITLPRLDPTDAVELLRVTVDPGRLRDDQEVTALARACAYLPLALRIAAARLADAPHLTAAGLAADLTTEGVDLLAVPDDDQMAVRTAFDASYDTLSADAQRLFRLLGIAPGVTFSPAAAAALAGVDTSGAFEMLQLRHLVEYAPQATAAPNYHMHDLLRSYAAQQARQQEADARDAVGRLLDWYLAGADAATAVLNPNRRRPPDVPRPAEPISFADHTSALAWLQDEHANLVAAIERSAADARHGHTWRLAQALWSYFYLRGRLDDWIRTHRLAVEAARQEGHEAAEAESLHNLATAYWQASQYAEAAAHYRRALRLRHQIGDRDGAALTLGNLGVVAYLTGQFRLAHQYLHRAWSIREQLPNQYSEAILLNSLSAVNHRLGRHQQALEQLWQARGMFRLTGNRHAEAATVINLGVLYGMLGRPDEERHYAEVALAMMRELGDSYQEAASLATLAQAAARRGEVAEAREYAAQSDAKLAALANPGQSTSVLLLLADTEAKLGDPATALARFEALEASATAEGSSYFEARAHYGRARMLDELGRHDEATPLWAAALRFFQRSGSAEAAEVRHLIAARKV